MIGLDTRMIDYSGIGATIRGLLGGFSDEQRKRVALYGLDKAPFPVYGLRQHWAFGRMLNRERLSFYHMPHYDVPLSYKGPLVATVHDLIHYLFPQYSTKPFTRHLRVVSAPPTWPGARAESSPYRKTPSGIW